MENDPSQPAPIRSTSGTNSPTHTVITGEVVKEHIKQELFFPVLRYLIINLRIMFIYGVGLITDYLLFTLIWWLIKDDSHNYPIIAVAVDNAKIGLGILFAVSALIHGFTSTLSQIKFDYELWKEERKKK